MGVSFGGLPERRSAKRPSPSAYSYAGNVAGHAGSWGAPACLGREAEGPGGGLRLHFAAEHLPELLEEAAKEDMTPLGFLDRMLEREMERHEERRVAVCCS